MTCLLVKCSIYYFYAGSECEYMKPKKVKLEIEGD